MISSNSYLSKYPAYATQSAAKPKPSIGALGAKQAAASCSAPPKPQVVFCAATARREGTRLTFYVYKFR